ncbi:hypothetical protein G6F24_017965 [Rhizopus arrhizus]|nr:hypothetical protein G6F24_017965 [Rhizopus arrhizus]
MPVAPGWPRRRPAARAVHPPPGHGRHAGAQASHAARRGRRGPAPDDDPRRTGCGHAGAGRGAVVSGAGRRPCRIPLAARFVAGRARTSGFHECGVP